MIFKEIYIKNYRSLVDFTIKFDMVNDFYRNIYNNMNLNVIAGENGSGKSSLLAFIASVFHNLSRYPERIESDFKFIYNLNGSEDEITICLEFPSLEIKTKKKQYQFFLEDSIEELDLKKFKKSNYDSEKFLNLLPKEVTVSNFSIDSFFPKERPYNFIGKRININKVDSHKSIAAKQLGLSRGIVLFFKKYNNRNFREKLKKSFNLEFYEKTPFYIKSYNDDVIQYIYEKYSHELTQGLNMSLEYFIQSIHDNSFFSSFIEENDDFFTYSDVLNILAIVNDSNQIYYKILMELIENETIYLNDIKIIKGKREAIFSEMSSGEKSFIYRILGSLSNAYDNSIIIFDELESHLNILWIRDILWFIKELFSDFHLQMFISTHSYLFINSIFNENLIFLEDFKVKKIKEPIFLANEVDIFKLFFPNQNVFSLFEESIIEMFVKRKIKSEELNQIANSYMKFLLLTSKETLND